MSIQIEHRVSHLLRQSQRNLQITRNNIHGLVQTGALDYRVGNELQGLITSVKEVHDALAVLVHDLRRTPS
ncbi:MAG TPA: hypothetical protein VM870_05185 [Pyrinomonadaceae bacterium]|jgi:hypothetical protein|nr:hypothetical protein [Pyrinomonadaceae bacterium]